MERSSARLLCAASQIRGDTPVHAYEGNCSQNKSIFATQYVCDACRNVPILVPAERVRAAAIAVRAADGSVTLKEAPILRNQSIKARAPPTAPHPPPPPPPPPGGGGGVRAVSVLRTANSQK